MLCFSTLPMLAGGSTTYYYKAKASVGTGEGKVYASKTATTEEARAYSKESNQLDWGSDENGNTENNIYLYATPEAGYKFNNWTLNGKQVSTSAECILTVPGIEDEENKVNDYVANFVTSDTKLDGLRDGYFRIRNKKTGNYICIVNDIPVDYQTIIANAGGALKASGKMDEVFKSLSDDYIAKDLNMLSDANKTSSEDILYLNQNGTKFDVGSEGTSLSTLATGKYHGENAGDVTFTNCYAIFTDMSNGSYQISLNPTVTVALSGTKITNYIVYFSDNNGKFGLSQTKPYDDAEEYQWEIEPVEYFCVKPMNENIKDGQGYYWTTLTTAFPYTIPEGSGVLGAYTVSATTKKEDGKTYAELTTLAKPGETVPAETPVLLKLSSADVAQNKLVPTGSHVVGNSSKKVTKNLLSGVYLSGKVKNNTTQYRVLNVSPTTGKIGFFKLSSSVSYMGANKAFLELPETAAAKGTVYIDFDNIDAPTTGINNVQNQDAAKGKVVYDLQGRRVENPQHGVYIVNGKKVVIK